MGFVKHRMIEEEEQGWSYSDDLSVCWRCVTEPYLQAFVKDNAEGNTCDFCKRTTRQRASTIPFDDLMEVVAEAIYHRYSDVDNEGIIWDHEDSQYMGVTYSIDEIFLFNIPLPSESDAVTDHIIESFADRIWCQRHYGSLTREQRYRLSWKGFCETVTTRKRYLFERKVPRPEDDDCAEPLSDGIPVREMLDELGSIIERHGLAKTLPAGTAFSRVRLHDVRKRPAKDHELGPPPPADALSNRMSPAGISLFYAALDPKTARAEMSTRNRQRFGTICTWTAARDLTVIDLTHHTDMPSFYDTARADERDEISFLRHFVNDLAKPVAPDRREHTEYVPTQIVTEYFRHIHKTPEGDAIDGLLYPSSIHPDGVCGVLFFGYDDIHSEFPSLRPAPLVIFQPKSVRHIRLRTP